MPYNADKSIFKTSPTEKNCRKKVPTAAIPYDTKSLVEDGTLKRIEIWNCVEQKLYVFDAAVAVKYIKYAHFSPHKYILLKFAVFPYKKVPQLYETEACAPNMPPLILTSEEIRVLQKLLKRAGI